MRIDDLLNIVQLHAERIVDRRANGFRVGTVQSYDPKAHAVKLSLQPEGTITGWMPLATLGVCNGFGVYVGATTGHAYVAYFHEGDLEAGIIIGRLPTDEESPIQVQSGEIVLQNPTGSFIKLLQDGSVTAQDKDGAIIQCDGSGNITLTGKAGQTVTLDANGDITLVPSGSGFVNLGAASPPQFVMLATNSPATKVKAL